MNTDIDYINRQIIPRWYAYDIAYKMGEIQSDQLTSPPKIIDKYSYKIKEFEWLKYKELPYANELVGTALILSDFDNPSVSRASEFILKNRKNSSKIAIEIAEKILNPVLNKDDFDVLKIIGHQKDWIRGKIALLKSYVRSYPINPIPWVDLGFYYATIGQNKQAEYCITVALNLGADNRFILRSVSRFFLHMEQPEKALHLLQNASLTNIDPWLVASEISISQAFENKTKRIKMARSMIERSTASPRDLAELSGTIGTLEYNNGSGRQAKKLFKIALIDPNENTLAQAEWIAPKMGVVFERKEANIPALFEANARMNYRNGKYEESLKASKKWFKFQRYSSQPVVFGSYIASVCLQNDDEAIRLIEEGMVSSPQDYLLRNNYAFSLASVNKVQEALKAVKSIKRGSLNYRERATLLATFGLISFRNNDIDKGRKLYKESIDEFKKIRREDGMALAYLFWSREESRINSDLTSTLLEKSKNLSKKLEMNEIKQYVKIIEEQEKGKLAKIS